MKTNALLTGCFVLFAVAAASSSLWAQDTPGDIPPPPAPPAGYGPMAPPPGGPGLMRPDPVTLDTDGNGVISASEFSDGWGKVTENRFRELDANADGSLSMEEFEKAPRPGRGPFGRTQGPGGVAGPPPPPPAGEVQGQYPPDGMPKGQRPPRRPPFAILAGCDANGDGIISEAEFLVAHQQMALERFRELDTDGDGNVTPEQLNAARGPMGGSRGPRGARGGLGGGRGPRGQFGPGGPRP